MKILTIIFLLSFTVSNAQTYKNKRTFSKSIGVYDTTWAKQGVPDSNYRRVNGVITNVGVYQIDTYVPFIRGLEDSLNGIRTFTQNRINDTAAAIRGSVMQGYKPVKRITDTTTSSVTLANVGGMNFAVTAGIYYHFKYCLTYSSAALTTGIRLSLTYPSVTTASASVTIHGLAADGAASEFSGTINSSGDVVTSTAVAVINVNYTVVIEGTILPSTSGNLVLQMGSEIAASGVTLKRGSIGYLWSY